jgi:hypothetical protein
VRRTVYDDSPCAVFFRLSLLLGPMYHFSTLLSNILNLEVEQRICKCKIIGTIVESGIYVRIKFVGSLIVEDLG